TTRSALALTASSADSSRCPPALVLSVREGMSATFAAVSLGKYSSGNAPAFADTWSRTPRLSRVTVAVFFNNSTLSGGLSIAKVLSQFSIVRCPSAEYATTLQPLIAPAQVRTAASIFMFFIGNQLSFDEPA